MQTKLSPEFSGTAQGDAAEGILRSCVHCGFCNATCPTYQVLGDELDGPRGRIYLIKQMLEGGEVGRSTQLHLDRCLTCLNCETTCPSGVEYGKLVAIGRALVDERVARPATEKVVRWSLKEGLTSPLFAPLLKTAQAVRGVLPEALEKKLPRPPPPRARMWPSRVHERKVVMLAGCVQPAMMPNINSATARVLDAAGIQTLVAADAGCCGALRDHLSDHEGGLVHARRNIDAWWPLIEGGAVEAVVTNASACGLAVKHYGEALRDDPAYAEKSARVSALAQDLSELLPDIVAALRGSGAAREGRAARANAGAMRLAFHPPCTLQHGQRLRGGVEAQLKELGFEMAPFDESHLCCGSAGTYSLLQPELAGQLRDRKVKNLAASDPHCIVSANVGCIQHIQAGTEIPVRHWVEVVDALLDEGGAPGG